MRDGQADLVAVEDMDARYADAACESMVMEEGVSACTRVFFANQITFSKYTCFYTR
jgi:hypothetical protein